MDLRKIEQIHWTLVFPTKLRCFATQRPSSLRRLSAASAPLFNRLWQPGPDVTRPGAAVGRGEGARYSAG